MKHQHICPRCRSKIPESHVFGPAIVCAECGWSASAVRAYKIEEQKGKIINALWFFAFAMMFSFFVTASWGVHTLEVMPIKFAQWTGKANYEQLTRLAEICKEKKNERCLLDTYKQITQQNEKAINENLIYGRLLLERGYFDDSIVSLTKYLKKNKGDMEAHYFLAKAYSKIGDMDKARKHYNYSYKLKARQIIKKRVVAKRK